MDIILQYIIIILFIILSGIFSGLTLGLMGLDTIKLDIISSSNNNEGKYAKGILPIRKKGNLLLCTLLISNVSVNVALSIISTNLFNSLYGFILSTIIIVIFGEIIPQAYSSKNSLYIGYKFRYFIKFLIIIMYIIAYPISLLLDKIIGDEIGYVYNNEQIKKLVEINSDNNNSKKISKIVSGALDLEKKKVEDIMVYLNATYMIDINSRLNFDLLLEIFKSGHSRIPIYNIDHKNKLKNIIGILHVKDLILIDPDDEIPVSTIIELFNRNIIYINVNNNLLKILNEFSSGKSHIGIIYKTINNKKDYIGILTIEDIIETVFQFDIVDETDVYINIKKNNKLIKKNFDINKLILFDHRKLLYNQITLQEINVLISYLKHSSVFLKKYDYNLLKKLILKSKIMDIKVNNSNRHPYNMIYDNGLILYKQNKIVNYVCIVLEGKVEIYFSSQNFRSEVSRWYIFCLDFLNKILNNKIKENIKYIPDFTARIINDCKLLIIEQEYFYNILSK